MHVHYPGGVNVSRNPEQVELEDTDRQTGSLSVIQTDRQTDRPVCLLNEDLHHCLSEDTARSLSEIELTLPVQQLKQSVSHPALRRGNEADEPVLGALRAPHVAHAVIDACAPLEVASRGIQYGFSQR